MSETLWNNLTTCINVCSSCEILNQIIYIFFSCITRIDRQSCYMVRADELYNEVTHDASGKGASQGMFVGCFVDTATGWITYTCEGKETSRRFKVDMSHNIGMMDQFRTHYFYIWRKFMHAVSKMICSVIVTVMMTFFTFIWCIGILGFDH